MKSKWMNRKAGVGILAAALTVGAAGTVVAASNNNSSATVPDNSKVIGIQRAEAIALQKVPGGTVESIELDRERGKLYYEVDVNRSNGSDVDVHIDALSGAVVKSVNDDNDDDDAYVVPGKGNNSSSATVPSTAKVKTVDQAIAIAKTAVNGTVTDVERDREDGRIQYEVELRFTGGEAKVEIDAATGKIVKVDKDYDDHDDDHDND
ncbi:PepSY domain-containing protein [Paenibacillus hunanensis]|uniref:PepSY domain-containing protein n=1 Tax=Paenibacillus hunanensis TaxID=539262 RepID=UPI002A69FA0C|nr:PepSY domain-containing protein [Paenibacillus hunanensis]WPP39530.1 PepSY domain-containing protein [Paenibacillus hunanensis]